MTKIICDKSGMAVKEAPERCGPVWVVFTPSA